MSLILEALKKSEAKRRLGEAPDLGTPFTAPRRRSVVLPVAIVLIAAALVWWGFFSGSAVPPKGRDADQQATRQSTPELGQSAAAPLRAVTGGSAKNATTPPANPPNPAARPNEPSFVAVGPMTEPNELRPRPRAGLNDRARLDPPTNLGAAPPRLSRPAAPSTVQLPAAAAPTAPAGPSSRAIASIAPATDTVSTPRATPTAVAPAVSPANPNLATAATPPANSATASPVAASVSAPTPTAPIAPIANDAVPSAPLRAPKGPGTIGAPPSAPAASTQNAQPYSELAFSVRKSLPELRLSMHVYTADPAQRFVILNDSRLGEGEKTTDDVFVREVRPDGVVLEFQSQRFFYPRDGL